MILPLRVFGSMRDEVQLADDRDGAELVADGLEQRLPQFGRRLVAVLQQDERGDHFAARLVGPADDAAFGDGWMREERALDFDRAEAMRGDLDHFVGAPGRTRSSRPRRRARSRRSSRRSESSASSRRRSAPARPTVAGVMPGNGRFSTMMPFLVRPHGCAVERDDGRIDAGQRNASPTPA